MTIEWHRKSKNKIVAEGVKTLASGTEVEYSIRKSAGGATYQLTFKGSTTVLCTKATQVEVKEFADTYI